MPQLDLSSYPSQLLWLLFSFLSLYLFVSCWLFPTIQRILNARQSRLDDDYLYAKTAGQKFDSLKLKHAMLVKEANDEAFAAMEKELTKFKEKADKDRSKLSAKLSKASEDLNKKLDQEADKFRQNMDDDVLEYASFLLEKVSGKKVSAEELQQYLSKVK